MDLQLQPVEATASSMELRLERPLSMLVAVQQRQIQLPLLAVVLDRLLADLLAAVMVALVDIDRAPRYLLAVEALVDIQVTAGTAKVLLLALALLERGAVVAVVLLVTLRIAEAEAVLAS